MRIMAPRKTSLHAWLWLLQIITGLGLCVYVCIHVLDVGSVLLGKGIYDRLSHSLEAGTFHGMATIVLYLVGLALIIHGINGLRVASRPYRDPAKFYRHARGVKHRGTWLWILQVVSGSILVAFLAIHYFLIHAIDSGNISFERTSARMMHSWVVLLYGATLIIMLYHTFNGLRSVLIKLGVSAELVKENRLVKVLTLVGLVAFIIGIIAIIRFLTIQ